MSSVPSLLLLFSALVRLSAEPFGPETVREFSIRRENRFEFAQAPSVRQVGQQVQILFATQSACDVTVAIEDSDGRIIRHLANGILGPNAPAPFKRDSLSQRILWDTKDDFGRYIDDLQSCSARVSLGLQATFERNLYWHPHRKLGDDTAIAIDEDGVYVYENNLNDYVRAYDHEGNYLRTIYPFAADKLKQIRGLKTRPVPPDRKLVPDKKAGYGESESTVTLLPIMPHIFKVGEYYLGDMAVHRGLLNLFGHHVGRVGTDGTTRGQELVGPACEIDLGKLGSQRAHNIALSPDGKWAYMTRVFWQKGWAPYASWPHAVYRMALDGSAEPKLFLGQSRRGSDNAHFNSPTDVATDARGRVYVTDWDNDRVQVFSSGGEYLRTIGGITGPSQVQVHPKTGEIYVFCWQCRYKDHYGGEANRRYNRRTKRKMLKFASIDSSPGRPELLMEASLDFPIPPAKRRRFGPTQYFTLNGNYDRCVVDFYSRPTRIWVATGKKPKGGNRDSLFLLEEADGKLILKRNFNEEVTRAGYRQHVAWFQRQFLFFDPVRAHLYLAEMDANEMKNFTGVIRIDVNTGEHKWVKLPKTAADAAFDAQGNFYLRVGSTVTRYDPTDWREIPYDYGEQRGKSISLLPTIGGGGSSYKYGAFNVSPRGEVIVSCVWRPDVQSREKVEQRRSDVGKKWTPQLYPGRPGSLFVHVYDQYGKLKHEDIIAGGGEFTGGLDMDWQGNAYGNIRSYRILDGKPWGRSGTGTLVKFRPGKGRLVTAAGPLVPLKERPKRGPEIQSTWVEDAEWLYGGAATGSNTHCWCRHGRFQTDYFGRVFVPEADQYSTAVLDPNGQVILRIGQYGNVDSAGPKSLVPLGGDGVALFDANFLATQTDKRLFVADVGNGRVFAVKLWYERTGKEPLIDADER